MEKKIYRLTTRGYLLLKKEYETEEFTKVVYYKKDFSRVEHFYPEVTLIREETLEGNKLKVEFFVVESEAPSFPDLLAQAQED